MRKLFLLLGCMFAAILSHGQCSITGPANLCVNSTVSLTGTTCTGGTYTWSSADPAIATVDGSGNVTGVAVGTTTISYSDGTLGGTSTMDITIESFRFCTVRYTNSPCSHPDCVEPIATTRKRAYEMHPAALCNDTTMHFTANCGGTFATSDPSIATITSTGELFGITSGTVYVIYTLTNSCGTINDSIPVTIYNGPGTLSGASHVCVGASSTLTSTTPGGTWTSGNTAIASIDPSTGVVTGASAGTTTITYSAGCGSGTATMSFTVNAIPTITTSGNVAICDGSSTSLTASGGVSYNWSPADGLSATNIASPTASPTVTTTYTVTGTDANGCSSNEMITVEVDEVANFSPLYYLSYGHHMVWDLTICVGSSVTSSATNYGGGVWSTAYPTIATVSPGGVITGVSAGTTPISLTYTNACGSWYDYGTLTIISTVAVTTGTSTICQGTTTTLSNATSSGTWSSGNTAVATIDATGVVTGVSPGSATITYSTSCGNALFTMTVQSAPAAITGSSSVCTGANITLADATPGGTWSSSNTAIATVGSTGMVHGLASGSATISYSNGCGTDATYAVSVTSTPAPAAITGTLALCAGANTTLADATGDGTWSSSNTAVATVSSGGMVHGIAGGSATISYTVSNSCGTGYAAATVTVNPLPNAGTIPVTARILCRNVPTTLTATGDAGGTWSLSSATYATINAGTGVVTGLAVSSTAAHTATVTYTVINGCGSVYATLPIRIKGIPSATITPTGSFNMCVGDVRTITMSPSSSSYFAWSTTSGTSVTTVSSNVAVVTGLAVGSGSTITLTYTNPNDSNVCNTSVQAGTYNVVARPVYTITGTNVLSTGGGSCAPATATLSISPSGGTSPTWTWTPTSPTTYASLSCTNCPTTNTVTALVAGGNETITYSAYGSYCSAPSTVNYIVTVNPCKPAPDDIADAGDANNITVYPNPAHGSFTIELPGSVSARSIIITDISGKVITTRISAKAKEDFDLGNYPTGLYFIKVRSEDNIYTGKVLLE